MTFNLNGRAFIPISNSQGGRVDSATRFEFSQAGQNFVAEYSGPSVIDGHLIGHFSGEAEITLLYHSRATSGELEAGEAIAKVNRNPEGKLTLAMNWAWLNGSKETGTSHYIEVDSDERENTA